MIDADFFVAKVRRQQGGVLFDSNVLLLYLVRGAEHPFDWKRTSAFTQRHLDYLILAARHARRLVTTPHILAEASNLAIDAPPRIRTRVVEELVDYVGAAREHQFPATRAVRVREFVRLGLSDSAQLLLGRPRPLVITVDAPLCEALLKHGQPTINLNHFGFPAASDSSG